MGLHRSARLTNPGQVASLGIGESSETLELSRNGMQAWPDKSDPAFFFYSSANEGVDA